MQWWFLGNMWPSESLRGEVKWLLHAQLVRGKARFHVKLASSRAGSSPAGHSKGMRVFLFVYFLWQPQLPQPHTRRSHNAGLLLSSSPLQSVLSVFPGWSTPWSSSLPSLQLLNPPRPTALLRSWLLVNGGQSSMFPQQRDHLFQLVGLPRLPCHHCPIQTEGSGSVSSHDYGLHF